MHHWAKILAPDGVHLQRFFRTRSVFIGSDLPQISEAPQRAKRQTPCPPIQYPPCSDYHTLLAPLRNEGGHSFFVQRCDYFRRIAVIREVWLARIRRNEAGAVALEVAL